MESFDSASLFPTILEECDVLGLTTRLDEEGFKIVTVMILPRIWSEYYGLFWYCPISEFSILFLSLSIQENPQLGKLREYRPENPPNNHPLSPWVLQTQVGETQGTFWMNCSLSETHGDVRAQESLRHLLMEWEQ